MSSASPGSAAERGARAPLAGAWTKAGLAAGLVALAVVLVGRASPWTVELAYSRTIYPVVATALAHVFSLVPFSLTDLVYASLPVLVVAAAIARWRRARRRGSGFPRSLAASLLGFAAAAGAIWLVFLLVWGANYMRPNLAQIWRIPAPDPEAAETLPLRIEARLNALRPLLEEDERGVAVVPEDLAALDEHLVPLQREVLVDAGLPVPSGARSKSLLASPLVVRWGVAGTYGLFTAESNVVLPAPPTKLPFTVAHELAHHAGIATEDGANFVALLTTWRSDDPAVRYSGWLSLWLYLRRKADDDLHPGVLRDLRAIQDYLRRHRGAEFGQVQRVYSGYLRSQGVPDGVRSYGRVAQLALAYLADRGFPERSDLGPDADAEGLLDRGEQLPPVGGLGEGVRGPELPRDR